MESITRDQTTSDIASAFIYVRGFTFLNPAKTRANQCIPRTKKRDKKIDKNGLFRKFGKK